MKHLPIDILFLIFSFAASDEKTVCRIERLSKLIQRTIHSSENASSVFNLWNTLRVVIPENTIRVPKKFDNEAKQLVYAHFVLRFSRKMKALMVGEGGVGKSALLQRYTQDRLEPYHDPTIEEFVTKVVEIEGEVVVQEIVDAGGMEEYSAIRDLHYRSRGAFFFVCSVIDNRSLDGLGSELMKIARIQDKDFKDIPMVIALNKVDVDTERTTTSKLAMDFIEDVTKVPLLLNPTMQQVKSSNKIPCFEVSAKTGSNVVNAFTALSIEYFKWDERTKEKRKAAQQCHKTHTKPCIVQ